MPAKVQRGEGAEAHRTTPDSGQGHGNGTSRLREAVNYSKGSQRDELSRSRAVRKDLSGLGLNTESVGYRRQLARTEELG